MKLLETLRSGSVNGILALGLVAATCSYIPAFFPIWGNKNTFSWEPFLERTVFRGQTLRWSIEYEF